MGLYLYENPETLEVKEVFQKMSEPHVYEEGGVKWNRLYTSPRAATDTIILDPFSSKQFVSHTANKRETLGDIFDRSRELSEKRKQKDGVDLVKKKYAENWSKERKGKRPPAWMLE